MCAHMCVSCSTAGFISHICPACFQVWFRRGVNSHNPCGSGWISIGGEMMMVDVGLNDQVSRLLLHDFFL